MGRVGGEESEMRIGFAWRSGVVVCAMSAAACAASVEPEGEGSVDQAATTTNNLRVFDAAGGGQTATYTPSGPFDLTNPFFVSKGSNGRVCATCHDPTANWGITPAGVQARFDATGGTDPLFRTNDGSNSPNADVSTVDARRAAYSMLRTKGLIRVGIGIPAGAEFTLAAVDDPYGYASAAELSLFRRPLPTTNLKFLTAVMWDGRETLAGKTITQDLMDQANGATLGHAQASIDLSVADQQSVVAFEQQLFSTQITDPAAGDLTANMGGGGPAYLSTQQFWVGINDPLGGNPTHIPFTSSAMTVYSKWTTGTAAQQAVARGEVVFNTKPIAIAGVRGINDALNVPVLNGFCTTCHDAPNVGNHSVKLPIDIGLTDVSRRTRDLPLYTLKNNTTGATIQTTDPGRALITGKWADIAKFKGPILRGLAARAPFFHNGSAATLNDAVDFYDTRFGVGFTAQEKSDLVAFLKTL
jgi:cytochrome c peroxidase